MSGGASEPKNAPELPIGRFLKPKSLGGNRVILVVSRQEMDQFMRRIIPLLGLALACGCGPPGDSSAEDFSVPESVVGSSAEVSAFRVDETKNIIYLDTQIVPGQRRRFDIGQGSITIQSLRVTDNELTFHYTPEVEGGYTIYECTVPVSPTPVEFKINSDGTPGKTSFDLTKCKMIRSGNVLLER